MVSSKKILGKLNSYKSENLKLSDNQSVYDIIAAISHSHKIDASEYDKIYMYFIGNSVEQTAKNIFNFLKGNTKYFMESADKQTVKSPAAILKEKYIDCKNYALFAGGILDAINRSGLMYIPFSYRFVSHNLFNTDFNHVFIVVNPDTYNELYIDPIPENTNIYKTVPYYYHTDKNFNSMALYRVSGNTIGIDPATVATAKEVFSFITDIFSNKPNPNDWMGWEKLERERNQPQGTQAQNWIINDGDSVQNEALNIIRYIEARGLDKVLNYNPIFNREITLNDLNKKLERGGYIQEARQLTEKQKELVQTGVLNPSSQKAGMNMFLTIGLVGAALFFLYKKGK